MTPHPTEPPIQHTCPDIHVETESIEEASESKALDEERICADFRSVLVVSILLTVVSTYQVFLRFS